MSNVLSRSNNPTGIRLPKSKAARFYSADNPGFAFGESTVTGNTPGGFVEFGDEKSGAKASVHDLGAKIKTNPGLTLGQFIEVHTSGDSTGIVNHKNNIPAILKKDGIDVNLDTLMSDIPTGALMNAVTQSEGGLENRAQFEPFFAEVLADTATVDPLVKPLKKSLLQLDRDAGQEDRGREISMMGNLPSSGNQVNLSPEEAAQIVDKTTTTDQTDPITKRLTADSYRDDPNVSIPASVRNRVDPIRMTERISQDPKLRQQNTNNEPIDPVDEPTSLVDAEPNRRPKLQPRPVATEGTVVTGLSDIPFLKSLKDPDYRVLPSGEEMYNQWGGEDSDYTRNEEGERINDPFETRLKRMIKERSPSEGNLQVRPATAGISDINDAFISSDQSQEIPKVGFIEPSAKDALRFERPEGFVPPESIATEGAGVSTEPPTEVPTEETAEDPTVNNSIFARLGRAIKDNPEIALSGAESLGSLLASIGQSRGQRKEDARVREATGRANLISALTGGRVRPQVASEAPELGLLGRIGQGLKVGGSTVRDAMEKQATFGLKEGELQRKIERDAITAARYISQNNLDEAKMQDYIDKISIGRSAEERKMLEAQIRYDLGLRKEERLSATDKWKQELANKKIDIEQAYYNLKEADQIEAHKQAVEALGIDIQRANAYTTRANAYANSIEKKALKDAKKGEKTLRDDFRKTVSDVRKEVGFLDSERGTLNVYRGLESAYANWEANEFNAAAATAVFNFYQQLFDPATVREGDLNMQKEAQGYIQSLAALKQRSVGEGFVLSKEQIRRMKSLADQFFKTAQDASANQINIYLDVLYEDDAEELNKYHRYYNSLFGPKGENESWFGVGQPTVNEQNTGKDQVDVEGELDKMSEKVK